MEDDLITKEIVDGAGNHRVVYISKLTGEIIYSEPLQKPGLINGTSFAARNPQNPNEINFYSWGVEGGLKPAGHVLQGPGQNWQRNDSTEQSIRDIVEPIKKHNIGGNMHYLRYFQEGGAMQPQAAQPDLEQIIQALQEDPEGVIDQLMQLGEQGQAILEALSQDPNIGQLIQQVLQSKGMGQVPQQRQGGPVNKDCGCKATLKRMGGRIVNIDCNGKIVR